GYRRPAGVRHQQDLPRIAGRPGPRHGHTGPSSTALRTMSSISSGVPAPSSGASGVDSPAVFVVFTVFAVFAVFAVPSAPPAPESAGAAPCPSDATLRSHTKNSTFPDGPGSGLATTPLVTQPYAPPSRATSTTASPLSAGSRTTPPGPTRSGPTSNCGLTMSSRSPPPGTHAANAGSTNRN